MWNLSSDSSVDRWLGTLRLLLCRSHPLLVIWRKYRCRDYRLYHCHPDGPLAALPISNEFNPQNAGNSTLLKELQAKYPGKDLDSRTKLSEEMRALYKEKGVKTSSAFLPLLIQMPVLMALFQALSRVEFLKVGHFLWLDLGAIDPTYILPVLAALFTFFSSWLTNKAMPERNGSATTMMYVMPVMIFFFALFSASGVALYWVTSNAYQVGQTYLLNNPFKIIAEREAKNKLRATWKNKTPCPKQSTEKEKIRKRWTYGPIYWSNC